MDRSHALLADLTPAQVEAVTHVDGPLLVLAAAGSGKTRVITRRVAWMLDHGVRGPNVLALTFTNKAAGEMRERIATLVGDQGVWVGTFHALCARLLRTYAPRVGLDRGFTIYDQADRLKAVKATLERLGLDELGVAPERVEAEISRAKNMMMLPEAYAARGDLDHVGTIVSKVYPAYQERLLASSAVDFDDLLLHVVTLVRDHKLVRAELDARFRYVLVDEYQDTNLAQYAIVRGLSIDHPNLCVTGDPDQSIYGWRGAHLGNILEFEHDYPGCKVVKLERNYRSTKNILAVADGLIRHNRRRKPKALTTENPEGAPVELVSYATETDEAQGVADRIVALTREQKLAHRDVAVFCRVTALTRTFESAFRAARIPYQVVGGVSYYERLEIKDALAYLNLMLNPKDDLSFLRAVNAPPRGVGATTLDKLGERARVLGIPLLAMAREASAVPGLKEKGARALRDFALLMDEVAGLRDAAAEEAVRRVLALSGYREYWADPAKGGDDDRVANLDELVTAARQFDRDHPGATVVDFLEDVCLASAVDRWKDEAGAVTLMTLHAAKGLEFPAVFIVGLEQGLLPHSRVGESEAELEEERRLLFVGMTRARRELSISYARVREFRGQRTVTVPSCFLSELPDGPLVVRDEAAEKGVIFPTTRRPDPRPVPGARPATPRLTTAAGLLAARGGGAPQTGMPDLDAMRPGTAVLHPEYGLGRILAIEGAGPNRKGRVAFTVGGERTFVLARSPLKPIGQGGIAGRPGAAP